MSENRPSAEGSHVVRVHIDQKPYSSPNPTTGEALYKLGAVPAGLKLYRETNGDREDPGIDNGPEAIHLREDEHFHSGKPRGVTIIVEGTPHEWLKSTITYTEVATLFDPTYPQHPDGSYKITYDRGHGHKPEGILSPGASVKVKEGMVFHVSGTGQS